MKEHGSTVVNPIYDWLDTDIWDYIKRENLEINPLYSKGYDRVGCIGCPLASYRYRTKEFNDYPQYKKLYIQAFEKMIEARNKEGKNDNSWTTGEEVFDWWMEKNKHECKGQYNIFDEDIYG